MSIYLIDYENVNADGFRGVEKLRRNDSVYVFYTASTGKVSFEIHEKLMESDAKIKYYLVSGGKNTLGFQLIMFAGYLVGKGISQSICIISNDKCFDSGIRFYENYLITNGVNIVRNTSIAAAFFAGLTGRQGRKAAALMTFLATGLLSVGGMLISKRITDSRQKKSHEKEGK